LSRQIKVSKLDPDAAGVVGLDEDVARLDVPVYNWWVDSVEVCERGEALTKNLTAPVDRQILVGVEGSA
jgi:hypothetical protein